MEKLDVIEKVTNWVSSMDKKNMVVYALVGLFILVAVLEMTGVI